MKKVCIFIFLIISFFTVLYAQEASTFEEVNEQYETFSWQPVAKAREYEVVLEKYEAASDLWTDYKIIKTDKTSLEILFAPGTYRVAIATYNLIGRRSKQSDWVIFKILEETIPYLYENFLPKSREWNIPVLYTGNQESNLINTNEFIQPLTDYEKDSIFVKGRNIFSPKTEFYLIPKDQVPSGAKDFINYYDERTLQRLEVLYRNSKEYTVVVAYDKSTLAPGYYSLEVRNPGEKTAALDILVLDDSEISIQPQDGFEIDSHYNVNTLSVFSDELSGAVDFSVLVKGACSQTNFYLEPTQTSSPYPFESQLPRERVSLELKDYSKQDKAAQLSFTCDPENLRTGYYNLVAQNWNGQKSKMLCLVKKTFNHDYTKDVKLIKTKYNKKTGFVDVTVKDEKFDASKTYTLISEYDKELNANNKVSLVLNRNGKKLTGLLLPDQLSIAKYALIIEDSYTTDVVYCNIDSTLKLTPKKMSATEVEKTFFRPEGAEQEVSLNTSDEGIVQFYDNKIELVKRMPALFNNLRVDLSLDNDNTVLHSELDIFNVGFVSLGIGYEYRPVEQGTAHALYSLFKLAIPNQYVQPYIGAGIAQNLVPPVSGINSFDSVKNMLTDKNNTYAFAQAGIVLLTLLEVKYNLVLNNLFTSPYFTESIAFGFCFPLRAYKFKRKVLTRSAVITKSGMLDAAEFIDPASNVDSVEFVNASSITGLAQNNKIETISFDSNVNIIQGDALRDCLKLTDVDFASSYNAEAVPLVIKNGAFAGDTQIPYIELPYRTQTVELDSFEGWTNGQIIELAWNSDDSVQRDLRGLDNTTATVLYNDNTVYKGNYKTPLEDERNWVNVNNLEPENVSIYKDGLYGLGINIKGFGSKWYRNELYTWINQENPAPALEYLSQGNSISFNVQGDGNKYDFIITTQDGGYFYYRFKTEKDKVVNITIPYKKFKKFNYSSQKKLDKDKIKMFFVLPMCKDEWNDVSLFDFEVK